MLFTGLMRQRGGEPAYGREVARRIAAGDMAHTVDMPATAPRPAYQQETRLQLAHGT